MCWRRWASFCCCCFRCCSAGLAGLAGELPLAAAGVLLQRDRGFHGGDRRRACLWGRTHPAGVDEWLRVGDGTGQCGKHPLELRPAAGAEPCLHSRDIAKFARWYLADYPVFCWTEPYGLFVIGLPKGSLWKYSIYSSPDFALSMVRVLPAAALGMLLLGLVLCFWLSWRGQSGWRPWQTVWKHWRRGRPFNCLRMVLPGNWQKS